MRKSCFPEGRGVDGLKVVEGEKSRNGSSACEDSRGGKEVWHFLLCDGSESLSSVSSNQFTAPTSNTPQFCVLGTHNGFFVSDFYRIEQWRVL